MNHPFNPLETVVTLVEFDEGPGLRIDIRIPWDRLKGLAQQIRWWSRIPIEDVRKSDVFSDKKAAHEIDPAVIGEPEGK
jgi:hypothetical protein